MAKTKITTPVYPTESTQKVKEAILKLFPKLEIEIKDLGGKKKLIGRGDRESLKELRKKVLEQKISDTARSIIKQNNLRFSLNKQAATVGEVNFKQNDPLGVIDVRIEANQDLINWLAPRTQEGEPI